MSPSSGQTLGSIVKGTPWPFSVRGGFDQVFVPDLDTLFSLVRSEPRAVLEDVRRQIPRWRGV